jgi:hypothetical protein
MMTVRVYFANMAREMDVRVNDKTASTLRHLTVVNGVHHCCRRSDEQVLLENSDLLLQCEGK